MTSAHAKFITPLINGEQGQDCPSPAVDLNLNYADTTCGVSHDSMQENDGDKVTDDRPVPEAHSSLHNSKQERRGDCPLSSLT